MSNSSDTGFNIIAIIFIIYKIGVPIATLIFVIQGIQDSHGFWGGVGAIILGTIKGVIWPVAMFF